MISWMSPGVQEWSASITPLENSVDRIIEFLPGLVWTALRDGRIDFFNQRAPRIATQAVRRYAVREAVTRRCAVLGRTSIVLWFVEFDPKVSATPSSN
jgi:hypothetical protein